MHLDADLPVSLHCQQGQRGAFGDIELPCLAQAAMLVMYLVEGHVSSLGASWMPFSIDWTIPLARRKVLR
jgi:hypothetical protein